jgi:hypothetical protein
LFLLFYLCGPDKPFQGLRSLEIQMLKAQWQQQKQRRELQILTGKLFN